jgi:hypothetical protein
MLFRDLLLNNINKMSTNLNSTMGEIILKEYSNGMKIHEIIKKYDLYRESEFNGDWKKMNKSEIEDYFGIKFFKYTAGSGMLQHYIIIKRT